ncbi:MAG TPA: replication-associated recombination protein A [Gemmatimonadota bacterium]|nr:replication-associated recombination protein A [Gemmatimonadota bacterium]
MTRDAIVDLFEQRAETERARAAPLADRMRPRVLAEFVGQDHLVGERGVLRRMIEADDLRSLILWGPPGTGKTTLAFIIAQATGARFAWFSAVTMGVADVKRVVSEARDALGLSGRRTILFCDEIHRFNKAQQDAFLPHVESGVVTLIGATTENPSFEVNAALLSRMRVYTLDSLTPGEIGVLVDRALADPERGLGSRSLTLAPKAYKFLCDSAQGDARTALSTLELAAALVADGAILAREDLEAALQRKALRYDKSGEEHYNIISALHKSLRDSDPQAGLYWLARMLEAGEDPLYVARRLVRFASEDVGLADPGALGQAVAAQQAVHFIGMPEGALALAQAVVYLAAAPKSNALYRGYDRAALDAHETEREPVPLHLRNAPTPLMKGLGYGAGYRYAHDHEGAVVDQEHLPPPLAGRTYYAPTDRGFEAEIAARMVALAARRADRRAPDSGAPGPAAPDPGA